MHLEPWVTPCVLSGGCFCPWKLWEYWVAHTVLPIMALQTPSAPQVLFLAPPLGEKEQKYMVISLDAEKAFDKIQYALTLKVLERTGIQG